MSKIIHLSEQLNSKDLDDDVRLKVIKQMYEIINVWCRNVQEENKNKQEFKYLIGFVKNNLCLEMQNAFEHDVILTIKWTNEMLPRIDDLLIEDGIFTDEQLKIVVSYLKNYENSILLMYLADNLFSQQWLKE